MPETRSIRNIEVFAPKVRIRFHTEDGAFEASTKSDTGGQEQSLVACQTYKDIGNPMGSFMIHLADFGRYDKLLKPMDLVTINMGNHTPHDPNTGNLSYQRDQLTHATMIGFIDSVRRKILIDPNTGKPNVFCEIKGSDFGKLMVKHQIRYYPWLAGDAKDEDMLNPVLTMFKSLLSGFLTGGNIDFLVANNLRKMLTQSVKLGINFGNKKLSIMNCLSFRAQANLGTIPYNLPLMAQEGGLWQVLSNFANLPFNEMWVDTINNPRRVIDDTKSSSFSSPLVNDSLKASQSGVASYIAAQSSTDDKDRMIENFGANGEKISTAENYANGGKGESSNAYTMLFLRRNPFDNDDWAALPRVNISNSDIQEQDLGVSDSDVYNLFWVFPLLAIPNDLTLKGLGSRPMLFSRNMQFDVASKEPNSLPQSSQKPLDQRIVRRNAVEKFGLRSMESPTRVWCWSENVKMDSVTRTSNLLTQAISNWYKHNSFLKSGSLNIKGIPDLHVGNVLVNTDEAEEYYVEGVANNYVQYQPMTTTVMVTRGQPVRSSPDKIDWGNAYIEFCKTPLAVGSQNEDALEINEITNPTPPTPESPAVPAQ